MTGARIQRILGAFRLFVGFLVAVVLGGSLRASPTIYVDASLPSGGTHDGATQATAYLDLTAALATAQARNPTAVDPVEIWVATGVYTPSTAGLADPRTATFNIPSHTTVRGVFKEGSDPHAVTLLSGDIGVAVENGGIPTVLNRGFAGQETQGVDRWSPHLPGDLNETDPGDPGFADNAYNVVTVRGYGSVLRNVVIAGGNANYTTLPVASGGPTPDIITATDVAGMLLIEPAPDPAPSPLTPPDQISPAHTRKALDGRVAGGGIFVFRAPATSLTQEHNEYSQRLAGALRLEQSIVVGNYARIGGGLAAGHVTVDLVKAAFINNTAEQDGGGFLGIDVAAKATDCFFTRNTAYATGGGVALLGVPNKRSFSAHSDPTEFRYHLEDNNLTASDLITQNASQVFMARTGWSLLKYIFAETTAGRDFSDLGGKYDDVTKSMKGFYDKIRGKGPAGGPTTINDVASGAMTVYEVITLAVQGVGIGLDISQAVDRDLKHDPVFKGFRDFVNGFNTYATPEGLATLAMTELAYAVDDPMGKRETGVRFRRQLQELFSTQATSIDFLRCEFVGNKAFGGGGISAVFVNTRVEASLFETNIAVSKGAAMNTSGYSTHLVFSSVFNRNVGPGGSGVAVDGSSFLCAYHSTFTHNKGAAAFTVGRGGQAKLINSLLWGNLDAADQPGADVYALTYADLLKDIPVYQIPKGAFRFNSVGRIEINNTIIQSLNSLVEGDDYLAPTIYMGGGFGDTMTESRLNEIEVAIKAAEAGSLHETYKIYNIGEGIRPGVKTRFRNSAADPQIGDGYQPAKGSPAFFLGDKARVDNGGLWSYSYTLADYHGAPTVNTAGQTAAGALQTPKRQSKFFVVPGGAGTRSGTSWANASDLATAMATSGAEVWVKAGTYYPSATGDRDVAFTLGDGAAVYGGFAGTETLLTERAPAANVTTLSGKLSELSSGASNSYTVVRATDIQSDSVLDGLTITGGRANGGTGSRQSGAGLIALRASPTIRNCLFIDNEAAENGGAIYATATGGTAYTTTPVLVGSRFENNRAKNGGALHYGALADIDACVFTGNTATEVGGAVVLNAPSLERDGVRGSIRNSLFFGNTAGGQYSGAIFAQTKLSVTHTTIANNTLNRSTTRPHGGAGLFNTKDTTLTNVILWGNRLVGATDTFSLERQQFEIAYPSTFILDHSDVEGLETYRGQATYSNLDYDPLFVSPGTGDYTLPSWSPLVDAGATPNASVAILLDLAGVSRSLGARPDMGAYEFNGASDPRLGSIAVARSCGLSVYYSLDFTGLPPPGLSGPAAGRWQVNRQDGLGFVQLPEDYYAGSTGTQTTTLRLWDPTPSMSRWVYRYLNDYGDHASVTLPQIARGRLYVKSGGAGKQDGSSWANAFATIEAALAEAAVPADPCVQIWVAAGTYSPGTTANSTWRLGSGIHLIGGFAGNESIATERNPTANPTILSAEIGGAQIDDNIQFLLTLTHSTAGIDGFTFRGAARSAIYNTGSSPAIVSSIFEQNAAAIKSFAQSGPVIRDCIFRNNVVHDGVVTDVDSFSSIQNSLFYDNVGNFSTGVRSTRSQTDIRYCVFWANQASANNAGVSADSDSTVSIQYSILWNNAVRGVTSEAAQLRASTGGAFTLFRNVIQGLSTYAGNGNSGHDPLFVDPWNGNFALDARSPAITLHPGEPLVRQSAGAIRFTGTVGTPLLIQSSPARLTACGLGGVMDFPLLWAEAQAFTPAWEIEVGGVFTPVASSGHTFTLVNGAHGQTLQLTLAAGASNRIRFKDTTTGYVHPAFSVTLSTPSVLRVRAGATAVGADGLSWQTALPTLGAALALADDCSEIWLKDGVHAVASGTADITRKVAVYGGFSGDESTRAERHGGTTTLQGNIDVSWTETGTTFDRLAFVGVAPTEPAVYLSQAKAAFTDCVFTHGLATGFYTPGVLAQNSAVTFTACTFTGNANSGAWVTGGLATFVDCDFIDNAAAGSDSAGAITSTGEAELVVDRSRFLRNTAGSDGGAISLQGRGTITNSVFSGNRSSRHGGAVVSYGELHFVNNTVFENYSQFGGGGLSLISGTAQVANSIFWGNTDGSRYRRTAASSLVESAQIYLEHTLPLTAAAVSASIVQGLHDFAGSGNLAVHPLFLDPEQGDFALSANSPAVDAGLAASLEAVGAVRTVSGSALDLGAREFTGTKLAALALNGVPASVSICSGRAVSYVVDGSAVVWERSASRSTGFTTLASDGTHALTFAAGVSTISLPSPGLADDQAWFRFSVPADGYTSPAYRLDVLPPSVLRVKSGSAAATPDGLSWETAFPTLEAAVVLADRCSEIWVAKGTYTPAAAIALKPGVQILGGFEGAETVATARQPLTKPTILRGAPVFKSTYATVPDRATLVDGFVIRPTAVDTFALDFTRSSGPLFRDCRFEGPDGGGALLANYASPRFEQCSFSGFSTRAVVSLYASAAEFATCTFEQNAGTLLDLSGQSAPVLTDVIVRQNSALNDNTYKLFDLNGESSLTLVRGHFTANTGVTGVSVTHGSTATIFGTSFVANTGVTVRSRPILINGGGIVRLAHVTIYGNTLAGTTDAWGALGGSGGRAEIINSIFWANRSNQPSATLEAQQLSLSGGASLSLTSSIVEGFEALGGTGNSGFDPFLADPLAGDASPLAYSPANTVGATLPDWAATLANSVSTSLGAGQFTGTSQAPVQITRRPTDVTVYARNPATFFADVAVGAESQVEWYYKLDADSSNTWYVATLSAGSSIATTPGRSTLTVRDTDASGRSFRYRIPSSDYTSPAIALIVQPRRVLHVKAIASGNADGSSWTHGFDRLENALKVADSSHEIWVAQGAYSFARTLLPVGIEIYGGFLGNESARTPTLTPQKTVFRGQLAANLFPTDTVLPETRIERVSFADGSASQSPIRVYGASLTLHNVDFSALSTRAIQVLRNSSLVVTDSTFTGNALGSVMIDTSVADFANCVFTGNADLAFQDVSAASSIVTFTDCRFAGTVRGVALSLNSTQATLERVLFSQNLAGALLLGGDTGQLTANNVAFDRNTGAGSSSGITLYAGSAVIDHATFFGNQGRSAGQGVLVIDGTLALTNSIVWGNRSTEDGGTLEEQQISADSGAVTLSHVIVEGLDTLTGANLLPWDPLFIAQSTGNLRLQNASPALDAALATALPIDIEGAARTFGPLPDLGAYELAAPPTGSGVRIRTAPTSVAVCSGLSAEFSVSTDGLGGSVAWHSSQTANLDGSGGTIPNSVGFTANTSTVTINPVPALADDLQIWFSVTGTDYVSPKVTLSTTATRPIFVKSDAPAGGDGLSWATAFKTLEPAILVADGCSEIWVADGTYTPSASIYLSPGLRIRGGFSGNETALYQRRIISDGTLFVAPSLGGLGLFLGDSAVGRTTFIEGLVIVGSGADSSAFSLTGASPRISDCVISGHKGFGALQVNGGNPLLERVTFSANAFYALRVTAGGAEVHDSAFTGNTLAGGLNPGSAISLGGAAASVVVRDSTFSNNLGTAIGADDPGATLTVLRSEFTDNEGDNGGAIFAGGATDIRHTLFVRNTARFGGAIYSLGALTLVNATVSENIATEGGGGLVLFAPATVTNSIFWNNRDAALGATVEQQQIRLNTGGSLALDHSLLQGLSAHAGAGNFDYDPLFTNNEFFSTYHLTLHSPAVETGSAAVFGADDATDADGKTRVVGLAPDLGAFEVADVRGHQSVTFSASLLAGLDSICAGAGTTLSVQGSAATIGGILWQQWNGTSWDTLVSGGAITITTSGTTSSLTVAASAVFVPDRYIRVIVAGTNYVSATRRVSQRERPVLRVDAAAPAGGDGLSWNTAFRTPSEALAVAGDCNEIWIATGTYEIGFTLTVPASVSLIGGFAGYESYASQADSALNEVVLHSATGYTLLEFAAGSTPATVVEGITLSGSPRAAEITGTSPTFRDVRFIGQTQFGANVTGAGAQPRFEFCAFEGGGTGVRLNALAAAVLTDSTFTGAGIVADSAASLEVSGATFLDTRVSATFVPDTHIADSVFERSYVETAGGGNLRIETSRLSGNNRTSIYGAALRVGSNVTATIINTVFSDNHAFGGGAIQVDNAGGLTLRNVVVRDNTAVANGGGVNFSGNGQLTAINSTFHNNRSGSYGGGIFPNGQPATLRNCILWGNTGAVNNTNTLERSQVWWSTTNPPANLVVSHSIVEGLNALLANANSGLDPLLVSVERGILAPGYYSPAIDLGDDAYVVANETDIRGQARVQFARVDAGAAEASSAADEPSRENTPSLLTAATAGRHYATSFIFPTDIASRLGGLIWAWQIDTGAGWRDLVHGVDGNITIGTGSTDLLLFLLSGAYDGARLRVVARYNGTLAYVSESSTLEVLSGRVARVLPGSAGGDGSTWDLAYPSLSAALGAASTHGDITEIWVAAGTYSGAINLIPGVSLYGGFVGDETTRTERAPATHATVLQNVGTYVVSANGQLAPLGTETVTDGFTISGAGNGVQVVTAFPVFRNLTITANTAHGIYTQGTVVDNVPTSQPRFEDCSILGNTGALGAGVYVASGGLVLERCTINGNVSTGTGGGVYFTSGLVQIGNSVIAGNKAAGIGAGLYLNSGKATLYNLTVASNSAGGTTGAGLWFQSGTLDVRYSIFRGNRSTGTTPGTLELQQFARAGSIPLTMRYNALEGVLVAFPGNNQTVSDPFFAYDPGASAAPFTVADLAPSSCSLLVDHGDQALGSGSLDLIGNPRRHADGNIDLGAYEAQTARTTFVTVAALPVSVAGCPGGDVTLALSATGDNLSYAWDFDTNDGQGFLPVLDDAQHDNVTDATLTVHVTGATQHGWKYRARILSGSGCQAVSTTAELKVGSTIYVDASRTSAGNGDGRSWATCYKTLTLALADLQLTACGGKGEIWMAAGTYSTTTDLGYTAVAGVSILGGFPAGGGTLSSRDPALYQTTLAGTGRIIITATTAVTGAVFDGVTLDGTTGGSINTILLTGGATPTFRNVRILRHPTASTAVSITASSPVFDGVTTVGNFSTLFSVLTSGTVTINRLVARGATFNSFLIAQNGTTTVNLTNSLIAGNSGSSINVAASTATANLRHVTFASNKLTIPAVTGSGNIRIYNSIIWGNTLASGTQFVQASGGGTIEVRYSDVQGNFFGSNYTFESRSNVDPQFTSAALASAAPTATGDYTLSSCSPFINGALNSYAGAYTTDVLGLDRVVDSLADPGAYEYPLPSLNITGQPVAASSAWGDTASFSVTAPLATAWKWQRSRSGGAYADLSAADPEYAGVASDTLTLAQPMPAAQGDLYRVIVSNSGCRTVTSSSAAFTYLATGVNTTVTGLGGERVARSGETITAMLGGDVIPESVLASAVAIHGLQTGRHSPAFLSATGSTLSLAPGGDFAAGERVWVSLTSGLQQNAAGGIRPTVLGYRAAVAAVPGAAYAGTPVEWSTDGAAGALVAGDFTGDGANDLAVSTPSGLYLYANNGAGDFVDPVALTGSAAAAQLVAGDLDGDGHLDLVAVGADEVVSLWRNAGAGSFTAAGAFGTAVKAVALGDLDGDGDLDLYAARTAGNQIWINQAGAFTNSGQTLGTANGAAVALGDFNRDGALDAMVAYSSANNAQLWLNNGRAAFTAGATVTGGAATGVVVGDLNGDGFLDVTLSHSTGAATIWNGDGAGALSTAALPVPLPVSFNSISPSSTGADVGYFANNLIDGNPSTYYRAPSVATAVSYTVNTNSTTPVRSITLTAVTSYPDGYTAPSGNYLYYYVSIRGYRANGSNVLLAEYNATAGAGGTSLVTVANPEAFSRVEFYIYPYASNARVWLAEIQVRGLAGGSVGAASSGVELADFDGNGIMDLWLRGTDGTTRRYDNNGSAVFTASATPAIASGAAFALADFGGSGALDLAHAPASGEGVQLRLYRTFDVTLAQGATHTFSAAQFSGRLTAGNQASVAGYRIVSLPAHGGLTLAGAPVTVGQSIPVASLGQLVLTPAAGFHGVDAFTWDAFDAATATLETLTTHVQVIFDSRLPRFAAQSASQNYTTYSPITLSVTAGGTAPFDYAWFRNGQLLPDETASTLTIPADRPLDIGTYEVVVSNVFGSATSAPIVVGIQGRPYFTLAPVDSTLGAGQSAQLSVASVGAGPISYIWYRGVLGDRSEALALNVTTFTTPTLSASTSFWVEASNAAGTASAAATISVDATAPVIADLPAPITVNTDAGLATAVVSWTPPTASDNTALASLTADHAPDEAFPVGVTTVTYTATDPFGNQSTASFTVTVNDAENPVITNLPANLAADTAPGVLTAVVTWSAPTATDNVGVSSFTTNHASGSAFPVGVTTVTYTALDAAGNLAAASFTVTVTDLSSPVAAADSATRPSGQTLKIAVAALLANDSSPTGSALSFVSVATATPGVTVRRSGAFIIYTASSDADDTFAYTIRDAAGLTATGTVTVRVEQPAPAPTDTTVSLEARAGGGFVLHLLGVPGRAYTLQRCDDLGALPPVWTDFATGTADAQGRHTVEDPQPLAAGSRFYRAVYNR